MIRICAFTGLKAYTALIKKSQILNLDRDCLEQFAIIKAKLKIEGKILDDFDILIACTAIKNGCVIVTNNTKHFERIEGLRIENWVS